MARVLVTGGSGFVGSHTIRRLLADGHAVRATVRSSRPAPLPVETVVADLTSDDGWADAVDGCEYVLHVASPFPAVEPEDENEVIVPARDGALRVLRAAHAAGVRRTVLTSSFAAIGYSGVFDRPYDENDWTNPADPLPAYVRSKTIAERTAWDYAAEAGLDLVVINPTGIFGPVLGSGLSASVAQVKAMLDGTMPAVPKASFGVVDVRDVADAHVLAMTTPEAGGHRFLATTEALSYLDVANILRRRYPDAPLPRPRTRRPGRPTQDVRHRPHPHGPRLETPLPRRSHPRHRREPALTSQMRVRPVDAGRTPATTRRDPCSACSVP
ncbi:SDR family oxidoreductase [Cryptosporangium sp. NPDC048952]|uniref:SDR family oxidoreductase n=1 Tax=Cryptosporangium sp. NPDC048952 TaxID=3363961 RepID=UPI003712FE62